MNSNRRFVVTRLFYRPPEKEEEKEENDNDNEQENDNDNDQQLIEYQPDIVYDICRTCYECVDPNHATEHAEIHDYYSSICRELMKEKIEEEKKKIQANILAWQEKNPGKVASKPRMVSQPDRRALPTEYKTYIEIDDDDDDDDDDNNIDND
eukprot:UN04023